VSKELPIQMEGQVQEVLPNATFRIKINESHSVIAMISGKMRQNKIQILAGDWVRIEVSPYDLTRGRVVYRDKSTI
jgi:translation initiation factor IF-1